MNYKTGGRQIPFADLLGWSPQYLGKLLKGENFGLSPVLTLLSAFPEINARWLLFGTGSMLEAGRLFELQRESMSHIMSLLDLDKYIPYMTGEEVRAFEEAVQSGRKPDFSPDTVCKWESLLNDRRRDIDARFSEAAVKSDELCRQPTAKK